MKISSFFKFVEIQTKVASVIPFFLGTVYSLYRFNRFNPINFMLMIISLLCIDMATTGINNYYDFKRAKKQHGYNYEEHNAIVKYGLRESTVITSLIVLLFLAAICGFILFLNTNLIVLLLGGISFLVGIFYSFGPFPISRTPLGEAYSGFFMGFIITFLSVYIHIFDLHIVYFQYKNGFLSFNISIMETILILLVSVPSVMGIANIMLANNICDIEDDLENSRNTLPIVLGQKKALLIFRFLYYTAYLSIIILLILKGLPVISVITLITFIPVDKNIRVFFKKQSKKDTFILSVKNFVIINAVLLLTLIIYISFLR